MSGLRESPNVVAGVGISFLDRKDPASWLFRGLRPRARMNRRAWGRGRIGVEHQPGVRFVPPAWSRDKGCHWWTWHVTKALTREKGQERYAWICYHQSVCESCGKVLRHSLDEDCPGYQPRD